MEVAGARGIAAAGEQLEVAHACLVQQQSLVADQISSLSREWRWGSFKSGVDGSNTVNSLWRERYFWLCTVIKQIRFKKRFLHWDLKYLVWMQSCIIANRSTGTEMQSAESFLFFWVEEDLDQGSRFLFLKTAGGRDVFRFLQFVMCVSVCVCLSAVMQNSWSSTLRLQSSCPLPYTQPWSEWNRANSTHPLQSNKVWPISSDKREKCRTRVWIHLFLILCPPSVVRRLNELYKSSVASCRTLSTRLERFFSRKHRLMDQISSITAERLLFSHTVQMVKLRET